MAAKENSSNSDIVVAVTGASGTAYAVRLLQTLLHSGATVHVVISDAARQVAKREIGSDLPKTSASTDEWISFLNGLFTEESVADWGIRTESLADDCSLSVYSPQDFSAGIASGSFRTGGMVICPCSMGTLAAVASGASANLIHRAADVHLKERRPLILVPRETPLGLIGLQNMARLSQAGATILPAMPGFYQQPQCIGDLVDFVVARICDHLNVEHKLGTRWGESDS